MKKVHQISIYIDETQQGEAEKIIDKILLNLKTNYYSSKDGKAIVKIELED